MSERVTKELCPLLKERSKKNAPIKLGPVADSYKCGMIHDFDPSDFDWAAGLLWKKGENGK